MILSLVLFAIGVTLYAMHELTSHGKIKFHRLASGFWGVSSWIRKYKIGPQGGGELMVKAPNNWYYKLIGVKYVERWPTSTWLTVVFTDAMHLLQFFYIKLFILSIVLYSPVFNWYWDGAIYLGTWYLVFNVIYKVFSK